MEIIDWNKFFIPYEQTVNELVRKFKNIVIEFNKENKYSYIERVEGRVKKIDSILDKARKKNIKLEELCFKMEDIAGIRIICTFMEDVDKVIKLIKQRDGFDIKITEEKDYIKNIKPSGYMGYHILMDYPIMMIREIKNVKVEIQIRTIAMNFWATIEHYLKYKYNGNIPEKIKTKLISYAENIFEMDKDMNIIRDEILEDEYKSTII